MNWYQTWIIDSLGDNQQRREFGYEYFHRNKYNLILCFWTFFQTQTITLITLFAFQLFFKINLNHLFISNIKNIIEITISDVKIFVSAWKHFRKLQICILYLHIVDENSKANYELDLLKTRISNEQFLFSKHDKHNTIFNIKISTWIIDFIHILLWCKI